MSCGSVFLDLSSGDLLDDEDDVQLEYLNLLQGYLHWSSRLSCSSCSAVAEFSLEVEVEVERCPEVDWILLPVASSCWRGSSSRWISWWSPSAIEDASVNGLGGGGGNGIDGACCTPGESPKHGGCAVLPNRTPPGSNGDTVLESHAVESVSSSR